MSRSPSTDRGRARSRALRRILCVAAGVLALASHGVDAAAPGPGRKTRTTAPVKKGAAREREATPAPPPADDPYPVWRQNQGRWANLAIHGMRGTIGQFGCALTAVAMQLRGMGKTLDGKPVDPAVLNAHIQVLTIESMAAAAGMRSEEIDDVDAALARGPVIAQIRYDAPASVGGGIGPHYVLLTGKDARGRYVIHDPLKGRRPLDPKRSPLDRIEHAYQILPTG